MIICEGKIKMNDETKKDLYIIQSNVHPGFLEPFRNSESYMKFLDHIAEYKEDIRLPIFAITEEKIVISDNIEGGGQMRGIPSDSQELCDLIDQYQVGKDTILEGQTIPITAVVDFTNSSSVVLGAYKRLEDKYNIVKIDAREVL